MQHELNSPEMQPPSQTEPSVSPSSGEAKVAESVPGSTSKGRQFLGWIALVVIAFLGGGLLVRYTLMHQGEDEPKLTKAVLAVNTIHPQQKTLVWKHEQPGSILPYAQAELYSKASGYVKYIRKDLTPEAVACLVLQPLAGGPFAGESLAGWVAASSTAMLIASEHEPGVDIGSRVHAGDILMHLDVPERIQDVIEREAALHQVREELAQVTTSLETFQAAIEMARAEVAHAEADIRRYQAEYTLRKKEQTRFQSLVNSRALEPRLLDEKVAQVAAARAAWDSSNAKLLSARTDITLATSKLATARAGVRVKQAQLKVAEADLERANILLQYGELVAPFDGVITYRGVDEGDFVQNSRTGQSKHLMTITSLDKVKVSLKVPSREGVAVRVGAEAIVTVDALPGIRFYGHVARTRNMLDLQTRTLEVEIDLSNHDHRLIPGMYAHVNLTLATLPNRWVIPASALYSRNKINYIIIVKDGVARRQPVRIVLDNGDEVCVVKLIKQSEVPLNGTEELVVSGKGEIADGQKVRSPGKK